MFFSTQEKQEIYIPSVIIQSTLKATMDSGVGCTLHKYALLKGRVEAEIQPELTCHIVYSGMGLHPFKVCTEAPLARWAGDPEGAPFPKACKAHYRLASALPTLLLSPSA